MDSEPDIENMVFESGVDKVGNEVGGGVEIAFVAQFVDDACALFVHFVLVVVVADLQ